MYMYIWLCNVPLRIYSKIKCCILCHLCSLSHFLNLTKHWMEGVVDTFNMLCTKSHQKHW